MAEIIESEIVLDESEMIGKLLGYLSQPRVAEMIASYLDLDGKNKVAELETTLKMIQADQVSAVKRRAQSQEWLTKLKQVLEQLLALIELERENAAMPSQGKLTKWSSSCTPKLFARRLRKSKMNSTRKLVPSRKNGGVRAILEELKGLAFSSMEMRVVSIFEVAVTMNDDRRKILDMVLLCNAAGRNDQNGVGNGNVIVISIVGAPGTGKTTLAQLVFDDVVVEKQFEVRGWACLSRLSSLEEMLAKVLVSVTGYEDYWCMTPAGLLAHFRDVVTSKRFLLVLDDVLEEDLERWFPLWSLLSSTKEGSRVILTSRSKAVHGMISAAGVVVYHIHTRALSEVESWGLFRVLAFRDRQQKRNQHLLKIGERIVKVCKGDPLLIKAVAALVCTKDTEQEWSSLYQELEEIPSEEFLIDSILKMSYDQLPLPLQRCLAYCSLFPVDYEFDKQELVHLWTAIGFVTSLDGTESLEEVGYGFLTELAKRCFLQEGRRDSNYHVISYKMQRWVHDHLAQYVAGNSYLVADENTEEIPDAVQHLSYFVGSSCTAPPQLLGATHLRSLILLPSNPLELTTVLNIDHVLSSLTNLHALHLAKVKCDNISDSLGELKQLRYLSLGVISSESLPICVTRLQNLQTLNLRCSGIRKLPSNFGKLTNLRHLYSRDGLKYTNSLDLTELSARMGSERDFIVEEVAATVNDDRRRILEMVLQPPDRSYSVGLSAISIVGEAGSGKTTLAQLVFDDVIVQTRFDLRAWAFISRISSFDEILVKILASMFTNHDYRHLSSAGLRAHFREVVTDKRYLFVLDDVWEEDRDKWCPLWSLVSCGKERSCIILTTRSKAVPRIISTGPVYLMGALSQAESWGLFRMLAFKDRLQKKNPNLLRISKEIVDLCMGIPLVIRTIAVLVSTKETVQEWSSFLNELREIPRDENVVRSMLILSYKQLPQHLQQCVAYCSLFPVDYEFDKHDLVHLWMAQGFISSLEERIKTLEEVFHGYLMELVRRSFLQEGRRDFNGQVISYKLQQSMHDIARDVGRDEYLFVNGNITDIPETVRHLSFVVGSSWEAPPGLLAADHLTSLLLLPSNTNELITVPHIVHDLSSLTNLRALHLAMFKCDGLPESFGELQHLRYLSLGVVSSESLPAWVTRLRNLQTLDLRRSNIRKLPSNFGMLTNLRHLRTGDRLIYMPPGIEHCSIHTLDAYIVRKGNGLDALGNLNGVTGKLKIRFEKAVSSFSTNILSDTQLVDLSLTWSSLYEDPGDDEREDNPMLRHLRPPHTLESLEVRSWKGVRFPSWGFPNLVSVRIVGCSRCQHLPAFSRLPCLRSLQLWDLQALEFIEEASEYTEENVGDFSEPYSPSAYFPSLECLELLELPQLKNWSRRGDVISPTRHKSHDHLEQLCFPRLTCLRISGCPQLMSTPQVPRLESMDAEDIHEKLLKHLLRAEESAIPTHSMLKKLLIVSVQELETLSLGFCSLMESLKIRRCHQLVNLAVDSPTPLRHLEVESCSILQDISSILQHLPVLEELVIKSCDKLGWEKDNDDDGGSYTDTDTDVDDGHYYNDNDGNDVVDDDDDVGMSSAWEGLGRLCSLTLMDMATLKSFSSGLAHLTMLQELHIYWIRNLRDFPEQIQHLVRLRKLDIRHCLKLSAFPKSLEKLTELHYIQISNCPQLDLGGLKDVGIKSLCLHSLKLESLPKNLGYIRKLQELRVLDLPYWTGSFPEWIGNLTDLRFLEVHNCPKLMTLSRSMQKLTALQTLRISRCPLLYRRCQRPEGEDWLFIRRIPHILISTD